MKALCLSIQLEIPFVENVAVDSEIVNQLNWQTSQFQQIDWIEPQHCDPTLRKWMYNVKSGKKPRMCDLPSSSHSLAIIKNFHSLIIENGILKKKVKVSNTLRKQIVVSKDMIRVVLKNLHNDFGHQGKDRVISLVRNRFYWNGMNSDIEHWIKHCHRCPYQPESTTYTD